MAPSSLTRDEARRVAVRAQLLAGERPHGVLETVEHLGFLQLDATSAVARSHLLVLWSRLGGYDTAELDRLLWDERSLLQWRAFVIPTRDWPLYEATTRGWPHVQGAWAQRVRDWLEENAAFRSYVLGELERRGPLAQRELEDRSAAAWRSSGWTAARNVSQMLEFLWAQGQVLVAARQGQQRVWDLAERVLPRELPSLSREEAARLGVRRGLTALGISTERGLRERFGMWSLPIREALAELVGEGEVVEVEVEGLAGSWYVLADRPAGEGGARTTLLSPFDSLIANRERTEALFDFHYRLEIYVPKAKRRYGYFVMPALHGERLVGRVDPQLDRKGRVLVVNAVHPEPGVRWPARAVECALEDLARFVGAERVDYR